MAPVTIEIEKGVRIRGRVVDPDGKPVGGATAAPALTGTGNSLTGDTRFSVKTKADGTFEMCCRPATRPSTTWWPTTADTSNGGTGPTACCRP